MSEALKLLRQENLRPKSAWECDYCGWRNGGGATLAPALSALNKGNISISLIEAREPDNGRIPDSDARA